MQRIPLTVSSLSLLSLLTLASSCASPPQAQLIGPPRESAAGFYAKAFGGVGLLEDDELIFDDGESSSEGEAEFDAGFLAGAAVGYRFENNLALEAEYTYRTNDVSSFESGGDTLADGGDFASTSFMVNLLYHFDTDWSLDPYVGVGFGTATEVDIDLEGPGFDGSESFSGSSPAAQYMVGVQGALTESTDFFVEGRFYRAFNPELDGEGTAGDVEAEYGSYSLLFGLSWGF